MTFATSANLQSLRRRAAVEVCGVQLVSARNIRGNHHAPRSRLLVAELKERKDIPVSIGDFKAPQPVIDE